jgi:hypothetical protein
MIRRMLVLGASVFSLSAASAARADEALASAYSAPFAITLGGGTTGAELGAAYAVNRNLILRVQASTLTFDQTFNSSHADYKGSLKFNTEGAFAEAHPFGGGWFAAAGVLAGDRKVTVVGKPAGAINQTYVINGVPYTIDQIIEVRGKVDFGGAAPYVGIGWDNTFNHSGHFGLRAALGVAFGDTPNVALTASGPLANDPNVQTNLSAEQASLAKDVKDLRYYPVASVSLAYRF